MTTMIGENERKVEQSHVNVVLEHIFDLQKRVNALVDLLPTVKETFSIVDTEWYNSRVTEVKSYLEVLKEVDLPIAVRKDDLNKSNAVIKPAVVSVSQDVAEQRTVKQSTAEQKVNVADKKKRGFSNVERVTVPLGGNVSTEKVDVAKKLKSFSNVRRVTLPADGLPYVGNMAEYDKELNMNGMDSFPSVFLKLYDLGVRYGLISAFNNQIFKNSKYDIEDLMFDNLIDTFRTAKDKQVRDKLSLVSFNARQPLILLKSKIEKICGTIENLDLEIKLVPRPLTTGRITALLEKHKNVHILDCEYSVDVSGFVSGSNGRCKVVSFPVTRHNRTSIKYNVIPVKK